MKESKVFVFPMMWLVSNAFLVILVAFLLFSNFPISSKETPKYSIFSSKPLTLGGTSIRLFGENKEAAVLDKIFESYKCPLAGKGEVFIEEAEKNNIPYWVVPAISFQESACGRRTPKTNDGLETYNAWGWGVWGTEVRTFGNWDEGIGTVSRYLSENFYSKGVTDICEIMETYTPPSDGSWCEGVKYFGDIIQNYKTPED